MPNSNNNNNQQGANSVSQLSSPTALYPQNMQQGQMGQQNQMNNQQQGQNQQQGVDLTQNEPQQNSQSQQNARLDSGANSRVNTTGSPDDYNYYEVEQQLIQQIEQIKAHADEYGPITEVVGRRSTYAGGNDGREGRGNGYEYEYKLADGRIVTNDQAWELANAGRIKNVISSHNHGRKYIRSVPDGVSENDLGNLPSF